MKLDRRLAERSTALVLGLISAVYLVLARQLEVTSGGPVSARSVPTALGTAGVLLAVWLIAADVVAARRSAPPAEPLAGSRRGLVVAALVGLVVLYGLLLPRLGFVLSTTGFLAAALATLGERSRRALLFLPATTAVAAVAISVLLGLHLEDPLLDLLAGLLARVLGPGR